VNWYERAIEAGIRDRVRLLRDNGFNTECSCEHDIYIQFQLQLPDDVEQLDLLLFDSGERNYVIEAMLTRDQGHLRKTATVYFPDTRGMYAPLNQRTAALESYLGRAGQEATP
jgi:hypothetical protein